MAIIFFATKLLFGTNLFGTKDTSKIVIKKLIIVASKMLGYFPLWNICILFFKYFFKMAKLGQHLQLPYIQRAIYFFHP
jgi:hypothetical protein